MSMVKIAIGAGVLAVAAVVAPGFGGVSAVKPAAANENAGHHRLAIRHHVSGEVVAVNADAKSLTVKKSGRRPREYTFNVADAATLANVKAGERVRVTYVKSGAERLAEKVVASSRTAAKK